MKTYIILFTCFLIWTSCNTYQNAPDPEAIAQTIIALEKQALDRWSAGDPQGFAANFTADATYFDDIGAQARLEGTEELQNYFKSLDGKISKHSYELVNPKVQVYDNIAILTFQYHSKIGEASGPPWKATEVYRLTNGKWQVVHSNWSMVKPQE